MGNEMMLARMIAQAKALGGDLSTVTTVAEEASEAGARRGLAQWQGGRGRAARAAAGMATPSDRLARWRSAAWLRMLLELVLFGVAVKPRFGAWVTWISCVTPRCSMRRIGGDIVRPGAFAGIRGSPQLLWQHRGKPIEYPIIAL